MAAILSSKPSPFSGRRTQTPMRSSRRSPRTLNAAKVRMIHSSSVATKAAHVRPAPFQVEHHIGHALARPVIGHLPAAPALEHRKARLDQLLGPALVPAV